MIEARVWAELPQVDTTAPEMDPTALALATALDSLIALGAATTPRSLQLAIGSSEAGHKCDRRLVYKLNGVPPCNFRDPLRALFGSEAHAALADMFRRLNAGSGRFLVETPVQYRSFPGTVDLYDRHTKTVVDWKSTTKAKLRRIRSEGAPRPYQVQLQLYAAGLAEVGEEPVRVALAYLPIDGELSDLWVWTDLVRRDVADDAVDRVARLEGIKPADATPKPDRLCPWCDHYRPGSTDLGTGCPADNGGI